MKGVVLISLTLLLRLAQSGTKPNLDPLSDDFINAINEKQSTWKAGRNFGKNMRISHIQNLMGVRLDVNTTKLPQLKRKLVAEIPDSFDWRDHLPECTTLRHIRDQGSCGSCWAVSATEVMSDRICIHSNGKTNVYISDDDVVSCCHSCGNGCNGGEPIEAFRYWKNNGIVSGAPYGSNQGCRPYEIPPCEHHMNGSRPPCGGYLPTPACKRTCQNNYSTAYTNDLHFAKDVYSVGGDVEQIQSDIMTNGPVTTAFHVYDDFLHYKSGVYRHVAGHGRDGHAVKILGWGVENDTPYWLIANSWNTDWGDNGYVKFLRGENHCGVESNISAGIPA